MKTAKSIQEKITLIFLFILSLPFTIVIFLGYSIFYILIFPFEYPFFKKSKFKNDLQASYHVFVTKTKVYKLYNNVISGGIKKTLKKDDLIITYYVVADIAYVIDYIEDLDLENKEIIRFVDTSNISNQFYLDNKENDKFIFY